MSDRVDLAMQEVWDWKRRAEESTRDMSGAAIMEFYRSRAAEVQQKFGLALTSRQKGETSGTRRGK
ncbi:MAG: hypothetical protein JXQ73_09935 [Phycisphaerae bacterium]|nr:hypothetical protein [Phycisphaerae bacterium]